MADALCRKYPKTHYFEASLMDKTLVYLFNFLPSFITDRFVSLYEVGLMRYKVNNFKLIDLIFYFCVQGLCSSTYREICMTTPRFPTIVIIQKLTFLMQFCYHSEFK